MNPPQIDKGVAKKNVGLHLASMLEALFEMRDCVGIPVVQQQRTTKIQRRQREAPFIIQFAERIGRLNEQVLASIRVPEGLNHTEWHQRRCLVPDVTKRGIKL